jgi:hypothetical protein
MRWLVVALLVSACTPARCQLLAIDILPIEGKPRPAGKVVMSCDGRKVVEIDAEKVGR